MNATLGQQHARLHFPRWTVRLRLTLLYGGLCLFAGAGVVAITYWLLDRFLASLSPLRTLALAPASATYTINVRSGSPAAVPVPAGPGTVTFVIPGGQAFGGAGGQLAPGSVLVANGPTATDLSPRQVAAQAILQHNTELHQLLLRSGIALAVVALLALVLGWLVAGRSLRPLRAITATTQQISEENLHQRLAVKGPRDELKDLGDTVNGLLSRLEGAFEAQRSFVANASHELRTPLTLAKALLQMRLSDPGSTVESYRSTCQEVMEAEDQQERLIESLLVLARTQSRSAGGPAEEVFDLAELATDVLDAARPAIAERGLRLTASVGPAALLGDAALVQRLISNLVDNAVRYNVDGGNLDVEVACEQGKGEAAGDRAVLKVANSGPVVPAEEVERLFQPFQRLGAERTSSGDGLGLGLSIVAEVARAHGALIDAVPRPDGGLIVTVRFLAARAAPPGADAR
jgi:signal transduction histidine kinase